MDLRLGSVVLPSPQDLLTTSTKGQKDRSWRTGFGLPLSRTEWQPSRISIREAVQLYSGWFKGYIVFGDGIGISKACTYHGLEFRVPKNASFAWRHSRKTRGLLDSSYQEEESWTCNLTKATWHSAGRGYGVLAPQIRPRRGNLPSCTKLKRAVWTQKAWPSAGGSNSIKL